MILPDSSRRRGRGRRATAGRWSEALGSALRGAVVFDAGMLGLVTTLLAAAALVAAFVPAGRAPAIDPARALRSE
jgi:ABC-type antimicrobial peptide transport system permease subunit